MTIDQIRTRLVRHQPRIVTQDDLQKAAVAIVLRPQGDTADFIAIHRAERPGDPWSGHMALPGGRHEERDPTLEHTVARETREEVGVDLHANADLLGQLDDVQAVGRGRPLPLMIRPYVFALRHDVPLLPNQKEVQAALWIPISDLHAPETTTTLRQELFGQAYEHPAWKIQGYTIWGLTHRILNSLLQAVKPIS